MDEFLPFEGAIQYRTSVHDVETKLLTAELPACVTEFINGAKTVIASRKPPEEQKSCVKQALAWVAAAASEAHRSCKIKNLTGQLLASPNFTPALAWTRDYPLLQNDVHARLEVMGERLHILTVRDNLIEVVGSFQPDTIAGVAARQDAGGAIPTPLTSDFRVWGHEAAYTHMLRLVAIAIRPHLESAVKDTLCTGQSTRVEFRGVKTYEDMVAATRGVGALRYKRPPRPAHNLDLLRICGIVETGSEMVDMLRALHSQFGFVKIVNEMSLPKEAMSSTFQLRCCKAYIQYNHPTLKTVGHLCRDAQVQRQWAEYQRQPAPRDVPRGRWERDISLALTWLRAGSMDQRPVRVVVEFECTVRSHAEARREMAELLRIQSAHSCDRLYKDYAAQFTRNDSGNTQRTEVTPLLLATQKNDVASIQALLRTGQPADLVLESLVTAAGHGAAEAVPVILKYAETTIAPAYSSVVDDGAEASADSHDESSEESVEPTPYENAQSQSLIAAATAGHLQITRMLLESKVSALSTDHSGSTALHMAASADHFDVAQLLIAAQADVNATSSSRDGGRTALHRSAQDGHVLFSSMLLDCKADVNKSTSDGDTAISLAAANSHLDILRVCIKAKGDINADNDRRETALFLAVSANEISVVRCLVENKADVGKAAGGWTPLMVAEDFKRGDIVKLLKDRGAV